MTLSVLGPCSCTKEWLNEKSDSRIVVPTILSDLQAMLDNLSVFAQSPFLAEVASDGHFVSDAAYAARVKGVATDAYIWSKTTRHTAVATTWSNQYTKLLYTNIVLDRLAENENSLKDEAEFNNVRGQALFQRARIFYDLAQIYSLPYSPDNLDKPFGIVLRKSSDIQAPSKRSTVRETYQAILEDLTIAKALLPDLPAVQTRGSRLAALGMLARVSLSMMEFEKAYGYADEILKVYPKLLDYNDISPSATFIGRLNAEVIFHAGVTDAFITSSCLIDKSLYDSYSINDLRKTRFFRVASNGNITFKGNYESLTSTLFAGIATAEIYLIRAECLARMNRLQEAMNDLNILLKSRWNKTVSYQPVEATSQREAMKVILHERYKELILRSIRWTDLRRLNQEEQFKTILKRTIAGTEYVLEPGSSKYTFPIPDDIVSDAKIAQNPGWE